VAGRPTFKKLGKKEFGFYGWIVGPDTSQPVGWWMVTSKAMAPDAITETWTVHDGSWHEVHGATKRTETNDQRCSLCASVGRVCCRVLRFIYRSGQ
jgi:hypothetical protein